jgi:hypothetical protein
MSMRLRDSKQRLRRFVAGAAVVALGAGGVVVTNMAVGQAASNPKTALINGDTVSGSPSTEQTLAESLGFTVTVATGAQWDAMTAAQFAKYQVLIVGDPTCGLELAPSVLSNRATWTSAVMATAGGNTAVGNRVLWGTDPVFHRGSHPGADKGIKDGIAFAGAVAGATGVYLDLTCNQSTSNTTDILDMLESLSTGTTSPWTYDGTPPCGGNVSFIGTAPEFSDITTADFQGWSCSVHESFPTFESDWIPLAIATDTTSHPTCGTDTTTHARACGEAYYLAAGAGTVATSPDISLTPTSATNPIGTEHTVTANVHNGTGGAPIANQLVTFTISGVNSGAPGSCDPSTCKTDASGNVKFSYVGTKGGDDTITASITRDGSTESATAAKHWGSGGPPPPPSGGLKGNIFEVDLRHCEVLHVGYNRFPSAVKVSWNVTQNGPGSVHLGKVATGSFTTIAGGKHGSKEYHFINQSLGTVLKPEPVYHSHVHFRWKIGSEVFRYAATRNPGTCPS